MRIFTSPSVTYTCTSLLYLFIVFIYLITEFKNSLSAIKAGFQQVRKEQQFTEFTKKSNVQYETEINTTIQN